MLVLGGSLQGETDGTKNGQRHQGLHQYCLEFVPLVPPLKLGASLRLQILLQDQECSPISEERSSPLSKKKEILMLLVSWCLGG